MRKDLGAVPVLRRLKRSNNNPVQSVVLDWILDQEENYFSIAIKDISETFGDI